MIYTSETKKALKLSFEAHYVYHPFHLAEQMTDENSTVVALLNDVVEDTEYTFEDLQKLGFNDVVIEALKLLTHDDAVPYMDYVKVIQGNGIARAVKLADLKHNSDLTRLDFVDEKARARKEKYEEAIKLLEN